MFIMSDINIPQDLIQVYDTKDSTNDVIRLSILASQITMGKIVVYGVGAVGTVAPKDAIPIPSYGIYISYTEAKKMFARMYMHKGYSKEEAYRAVGLY